jgi:hypothetical protein
MKLTNPEDRKRKSEKYFFRCQKFIAKCRDAILIAGAILIAPTVVTVSHIHTSCIQYRYIQLYLYLTLYHDVARYVPVYSTYTQLYLLLLTRIQCFSPLGPLICKFKGPPPKKKKIIKAHDKFISVSYRVGGGGG